MARSFRLASHFSDQRRALLAIGLALLLHGGVLLWNVVPLAPLSTQSSTDAAKPVPEIEVTWELTSASVDREGTVQQRTSGASPSVRASEGRRAVANNKAAAETQAPAPNGAEARVEVASEAAPPLTEIEATDPAAVTPRVSLAQAGYGEASPWVLPDAPPEGAPAPESATARHEDRLERNMAEEMLRRDYQRNVGIEGAVTSAIQRAAWSHVPPRSEAHLLVLVDENGRVSAVEVAEVNAGFEQWSKVAARVLAMLKSAQLRVPAGRRVEMVFAVTSKVTLPSGAKPRSGVSILGQSLGKEDKNKDPALRILRPYVNAEIAKVPNPGKPMEDVDLPVLSIGINVLELSPELADIGAPAQQVIHTRLVSQRVL